MKRLAAAALLIALGLGAAVGVLASRQTGSGATALPPGPYRGSEPPAQIRVPNLTLPSYRGETVSLRALNGKVVVVTFLDSKCSDSCPIIAAVIGRAWRMLAPGERRQANAYAISVNPRVDTPTSVRRFLVARHALTTLDWLVGPVKRMRPVWRAFAVLPAVDTGSDDIHSADVRVFDRSGQWVSTLHAGVDLTPENLAYDIQLALR